MPALICGYEFAAYSEARQQAEKTIMVARRKVMPTTDVHDCTVTFHNAATPEHAAAVLALADAARANAMAIEAAALALRGPAVETMIGVQAVAK